MKLIRRCLIGFLLGGGIGIKVSQLIGQWLDITSVNLLGTGMIIGGLGAVVVAITISGDSKVESIAAQRKVERELMPITRSRKSA